MWNILYLFYILLTSIDSFRSAKNEQVKLHNLIHYLARRYKRTAKISHSDFPFPYCDTLISKYQTSDYVCY